MSDRDAQFAQAIQFEAEGRQDEARRLYSAIGDAEALTALGRNLLTRPPIRSYEGVKTIVDAANMGDGEAIALCGSMAALGAGLAQNWSMALDMVQVSAERGWPPAQGVLRLLSANPADGWKALRDAIDLDALLAPGSLRSIHGSPRIFVAERFLPPALCDWLVARAAPKLERARIFYTTGAAVDHSRSNSTSEFNFAEIDLVLALIRTRIAALAGVPARGLENTQILHYTVGQRFAPHYDWLDPAVQSTAQSIQEAGQRVATFLIYLNDDFDAAETSFLKLDLRYRGAKGDAILFWNVDEQGEIDRATLHAGLAPTRGEKWLLSQWIRQAP